MGIHFHTKGRPVAIREVTYDNENLFCIDFEEESKAVPPKDLPKPEMVSTTAILNTKQFNNLTKSINDNGDTLETAHHIFIKGEIINGLPHDICTGDIGYVGFEVQYFPRKEGTDFDGVKINVSISSNSLNKIKKNFNKQQVNAAPEITEETIQLHKQFDGVCQSCGQRCDKRLVRIPKTNETTIVCIDCFKDAPKVTFSVDHNVLYNFAKQTDMELEQAKEYLLNFPSKYVLVSYNEQNHTLARRYWSWEKDSLVNQMTTNLDGEIVYIQLQDGKMIKNDKLLHKKPKEKNDQYIHITYQKYKKIRKEEVFLVEISVPATFQKSNPSPSKINAKVEHFNKHQKFARPIVLLQKEEKFFIIDGYTTYLAAEKLNLKKIKAIVVKKHIEKGVEKDAVKN
ncbi:hypothetical protein MZM54_03490 [[Brevibacterium] frigoritolerans]|nr:hypothetical protein [Peribacillus frigoritolerans]